MSLAHKLITALLKSKGDALHVNPGQTVEMTIKGRRRSVSAQNVLRDQIEEILADLLPDGQHVEPEVGATLHFDHELPEGTAHVSVVRQEDGLHLEICPRTTPSPPLVAVPVSTPAPSSPSLHWNTPAASPAAPAPSSPPPDASKPSDVVEPAAEAIRAPSSPALISTASVPSTGPNPSSAVKATRQGTAELEARKAQATPVPGAIDVPSQPALEPFTASSLRIEDPQEPLDVAEEMAHYLETAARFGGAEVMIACAHPVRYRQNGVWSRSVHEGLSAEHVKRLLDSLLPEDRTRLAPPCRMMVSTPSGHRFRCTLFRDHLGWGARFLHVPLRPPRLDGQPDAAEWLSRITQKPGFSLVVGPSQSGLTTTLASLVNALDAQRPGHIITLESLIEFEQTGARGFVSQRQAVTHRRAAIQSIAVEAPDWFLLHELEDGGELLQCRQLVDRGIHVVASVVANDVETAVERLVRGHLDEAEWGRILLKIDSLVELSWSFGSTGRTHMVRLVDPS